MPDESDTGASRFFKKKPDWVLNKTAGTNNTKPEPRPVYGTVTPPPGSASPNKTFLSPNGASSGGEDLTGGGKDLFRRSRDTQKIIAEREKKNAEKELKRKKKRERDEERRKQEEEEETKKRLQEEQEKHAIQSVERDAMAARELKRRRISDENEDDFGREEERLKNRYTSEDSLYAATPKATSRTVPVGINGTNFAMDDSPSIVVAQDDEDLAVVGLHQLTPSPSKTVSPPETKSQSLLGTQENAIELDLEPDSPSVDINNYEYDVDLLTTSYDNPIDVDYSQGDLTAYTTIEPTTNLLSPSTADSNLTIDNGPPIQIFISSNLPPYFPPTAPLIITRRYKQSLGKVREFWCKHNKISNPALVESVFMTWKGEKVFDVATLEMMGVKYEILNQHEDEIEDGMENEWGSGTVRIKVLNGGDEDQIEALDGTGMTSIKDMFDDERGGGVHLVATTMEMEERRKKEEADKAIQRMVRDDSVRIQDEIMAPIGLHQKGMYQQPIAVESRKYRVILRSKDLPDMKLLLKTTTLFSTTIERYRKGNQLDQNVSIHLRFDDEELLPEQTVADTAIAQESLEDDDVVVIDVHIK